MMAIREGSRLTVDDGVDVWAFGQVERQEVEIVGKTYRPLAVNADQQYLYIPANEPFTEHTHLYFIDETGCSFHNFSISELLNKKEIYTLTGKMREGEIKEYASLIEQYASCPGSLYWIALELSLAVYDERGSEEMDKASQQLFKDLAEKGDARACHELANHYYFNTGDKEEVIHWRTRAIAAGETADLKELAEFIIDDYPDRVDLALDTLHTMQQNNIQSAWAYWKEGLICMKGIGGVECDPVRGFMLTQRASDLGHNVAKSDLAFCYYRGVGTAKDVNKALQLLIEANEASKQINNKYLGADEDDAMAEGDFEEQIALMKQELNK